jgi:hypothetical protein
MNTLAASPVRSSPRLLGTVALLALALAGSGLAAGCGQSDGPAPRDGGGWSDGGGRSDGGGQSDGGGAGEGRALTGAEARGALAAFVLGANGCQEASECAIAYAACPLGCYVPVRRDRVAEGKVRELVAAYERGGPACANDCAAPGAPVCAQNRCALASAPAAAGAASEAPPRPAAEK